MTAVLIAFAFCGLVCCYDIASRMNRRTNHGIRVAVWLMGFGCILTMACKHDVALAFMLAGLGLFHVADRRGDHSKYGSRT